MHIQILHLQRTSKVNVPLLPEWLRHSYSPPSSAFTSANFSLNVLVFTFTTCTVAGKDWGTWVLSGLNQPRNVSPPLISHVVVISLPDGVCNEDGLMVTAATVKQHKINAMGVKGYHKPGWLFTFCWPMTWQLTKYNSFQSTKLISQLSSLDYTNAFSTFPCVESSFWCHPHKLFTNTLDQLLLNRP